MPVRRPPNNGWDSASLVALYRTCLLIKITLIAFPGLYNQLTFSRSNTGFLPSLAFTVTSFFSARITVFSLPWPLQSAYFFPQQYRFSPFPGLYDYLIFRRKNNGFLPSLAFTNSLFFSAGLTVFSLPWPLQTAYFFPQQ